MAPRRTRDSSSGTRSPEIIPATLSDAGAVAAVRAAAANELTRLYGTGHWSNRPTEDDVARLLRRPGVYVARDGASVLATFCLTFQKPWAIDASYFALSRRPLYLLAMAVLPERQRQGLGRICLEAADSIATQLSADAIRLDAYDAAGGAGAFYSRCGYTEVGRVIFRTVPLIYYERRLPSSNNLAQ